MYKINHGCVTEHDLNARAVRKNDGFNGTPFSKGENNS